MPDGEYRMSPIALKLSEVKAILQLKWILQRTSYFQKLFRLKSVPKNIETVDFAFYVSI